MLTDKVAVVTGSGRGIGQGVALLLADERARVVVVDSGCDVDGRNTDPGPAADTVSQIEASGGQAVAHTQGIETAAGGEAAIQRALDVYGQLDILVNVAGILRDRMVFNMAEDEWDGVIQFHLKGTFNTIKPAAVLMRQQRKGRIINFTSIAGLWGNSGQANYGAAKAGIAGLTRVAARDLGRYGVTVNCISPIGTSRMGTSIPATAGAARSRAGIAPITGDSGESTPAERPTSGTMGKNHPHDVAPMVAYLASDAAADVNGRIFHCAGGTVSLLSEEVILKTITTPSRWTPEAIAGVFPQTLGMGLANPAPAQAPKE